MSRNQKDGSRPRGHATGELFGTETMEEFAYLPPSASTSTILLRPTHGRPCKQNPTWSARMKLDHSQPASSSAGRAICSSGPSARACVVSSNA